MCIHRQEDGFCKYNDEAVMCTFEGNWDMCDVYESDNMCYDCNADYNLGEDCTCNECENCGQAQSECTCCFACGEPEPEDCTCEDCYQCGTHYTECTCDTGD